MAESSGAFFLYSAAHVQRMMEIEQLQPAAIFKGTSQELSPSKATSDLTYLDHIHLKSTRCIRCMIRKGDYLDLDWLKVPSQSTALVKGKISMYIWIIKMLRLHIDGILAIHTDWRASWGLYESLASSLNPTGGRELRDHREKLERLFIFLRPEAHRYIIHLDRVIRMGRAHTKEDTVLSHTPVSCCLSSSCPYTLANEASRIAALHQDVRYHPGIILLSTALGFLILLCLYCFFSLA